MIKKELIEELKETIIDLDNHNDSIKDYGSSQEFYLTIADSDDFIEYLMNDYYHFTRQEAKLVQREVKNQFRQLH
jgi:hypothetical protein